MNAVSPETTLATLLPFLLILGCSTTSTDHTRCPSALCGEPINANAVAREVAFTGRTMTPAQNSLHVLFSPVQRLGSPDLPEPGGLAYWRDPELGPSSVATVGAAYGITSELEVGAYLLPLTLSPQLDFRNPFLWTTFALEGEVSSLGIRAGSYIPLDGAALTAELAVPLMIDFGRWVSMDIALALYPTFGEELSGVFAVPYRVVFNPTEEIFFGARSSVVLPEFRSDQLVVPLGAFVGYSIEGDDGVLADVAASFDWPFFKAPSQDAVVTDVYQVGLGGNIFLYF